MSSQFRLILIVYFFFVKGAHDNVTDDLLLIFCCCLCRSLCEVGSQTQQPLYPIQGGRGGGFWQGKISWRTTRLSDWCRQLSP